MTIATDPPTTMAVSRPDRHTSGVIGVVGEALIDLVAEADGRTFRAYPGGSPANVAVGLARLDVPVAMVARLASDTFGGQLRDHLRSNRVDVRYAVAAAEPASLAVATLDGAGAAAYEFRIDGTADWQWTAGELPDPLPPGWRALHTGSLATALDPGAPVLEGWLHTVRDHDTVTVCLDPNLRPEIMGDAAAERARVERQVRLAHVVKVSEDDLRWTHPHESYVAVARRWLARNSTTAAHARRSPTSGPALVVVTRGADGAYAATPSVEVQRSSPAASVVDTVGAGDAFTAGLLAGLQARELLGPGSGAGLAGLDHEALAALVDEAALMAALTCARPGADPPTRADMRAGQPR